MTTTPPPRNRALHCLLHKWGKQRTSTSRWGCSEWVRKEQGNKKSQKRKTARYCQLNRPVLSTQSPSPSKSVRPELLSAYKQRESRPYAIVLVSNCFFGHRCIFVPWRPPPITSTVGRGGSTEPEESRRKQHPSGRSTTGTHEPQRDGCVWSYGKGGRRTHASRPTGWILTTTTLLRPTPRINTLSGNPC